MEETNAQKLLSRRSALVGGAAMAAAAGILAATPGRAEAAANSSQDEGRLSIGASFPLSLLAASGRSSFDLQVPARMTIEWPAAWSRDLVATVTYDPRSLGFGAVVPARIGQEGALNQATVVVSAAMATAQFHVPLPQTGGTLSIEVELPFSTRTSFPGDAFGPGQPVAITVLDANDHAHVLSSGSSASGPTSVSAWGVQLFAIWDSVDAKESGRSQLRKYDFAKAIQIFSVGPAPTPADLALVVNVDPNLIGSNMLKDRHLNGVELGSGSTTSSRSTGQSTLVIPVGRPLKSGDSLMIDLSPEVTVGRAGVRGIRNFTATVQSSPVVGSWQRVTGKETVTSVSTSGREQHEHQLLGTI